MSSIINVLRDIVDDKYIYADNHALITLKELSSGAKCGNISLQNTANVKQVLVLNLDIEGDDVHPFLIKKEKGLKLESLKNLRKKIDYLMFCEVELKDKTTKTYAFSIELKSDNADDWHRQARAGYAFAEYLISFIEVRDKVNLQNDMVYRCVLFKSTAAAPRALNKKPKLKTTTATSYETHPIYKYLHCQKKCGERYFIEEFVG